MQNIQSRPTTRKTLSKRSRFQVLSRDNFLCRYCGKGSSQSPLHLDHILPLSGGGPDHRCNLVTACRDCNLGKGRYSFLTPESDGLEHQALTLIEYHCGQVASPREREWIIDLFLAEEDPWHLLDQIQPGLSVIETIRQISRASGYPQ